METGPGAAVSADSLRAALRAIKDPASGQDIIAAGLIEGIEVRGGLVQAALLTDRAHAAAMEPVRQQVETLLRHQPGVTSATAVLTAHKQGAPSSPAPRAPRTQAGRPQAGNGPGNGPAHGSAHRQPMLLPGIRSIVAVASGKGGVGKSTVAVNLAVALARQGHKTGLLDADIYGPSMPRMLGLHRKPEVRKDRLIPLSAWGLSCMSIGFLVDEETPMIWRGPMVMGALEQMMGQVEWGTLDVLIVDMPPGTGDAQLTMAQRVALAGAVIVSTPQDIALIDARRGGAHVREGACSSAGSGREYELLLLPQLRPPRGNLRPWRGAKGGRAAWHGVPGRSAVAPGYPHGVG